MKYGNKTYKIKEGNIWHYKKIMKKSFLMAEKITLIIPRLSKTGSILKNSTSERERKFLSICLFIDAN